MPEGGRFTPRRQSEPTFSLAAAPKQRILDLLGDMEQRLDWAAQIVEEGEEAFSNPDNWRSREAMKSVLVDLNTAADRIPEQVRGRYPSIPWRNLRGLRNVLAHDYSGIRYDIVWNTAAASLPELRARLGEMRSDVEGWS